MKKSMIAASIALAVTLTACGKNDAADNAATSNEAAFDSAVDANGIDEAGNVTVAEDGSIGGNTSDDVTDPIAANTIGNAE
jgi:outer membrane lipoprotein SlyB